MVKQVVLFARGQESETEPLQLQALVRDMAGLARETFPKNIAIPVCCPEDVWPVLGNPTGLHQILLNLCVNARDAMPGGGTLHLALAREIHPGLTCLWISGDGGSLTGRHSPDERADFLGKPFSLADLLRKLHAVLPPPRPCEWRPLNAAHRPGQGGPGSSPDDERPTNRQRFRRPGRREPP